MESGRNGVNPISSSEVILCVTDRRRSGSDAKGSKSNMEADLTV